MIDTAKAYRYRDYSINSKITVRQPTLDEIIRFGEQRYFSLVQTLCATPADRKVEIWQSRHVYWDEVDEYELFLSVLSGLVLQRAETEILLPGLDLSSLVPKYNVQAKEYFFGNEDGVVIDRAIHSLLTEYLRKVHFLKKNVDFGVNNLTKDIMIEDDLMEQQAARDKPYHSMLVPMVSFATNCAGFKYGWRDVWELPIGVFLDAVERLHKIMEVDRLLQGVYAGTVDAGKINKKRFNMMGEL